MGLIFKEKIKVNENDKLIVMAYGGYQKDLHELIKIANTALQKFPNAKLVLKVHPAETRKKYENIIRDIGEKIIILDKENLYELINSSEALITRNSTTGLEAMMLKKPVIIFPNIDEYNTGEHASIYKNTNAVLNASNQEELESALKVVFDQGKELVELKREMKKFVFCYAFKQDGKATQRFVELVKKAIKNRERMEKKQGSVC